MALLKKKKTEEKKAEPKKVEASTPSVTMSGTDAYRILVRPLMTEKTTRLEAQGKYSFEVAQSATKVDVRRAIKAVYGADVKNVRMVNMEGKRLRFKFRKGARKHWKKAIVTLPKGSSIEIHTGV